MDFDSARNEFEKYLDGYDRTNDKVKLKITHTYGVVDYSRRIAGRMGLCGEDIRLSEIIALLHDIGRFEQLKRFDSFLPQTMDHAAYGVSLLFDEGMIRRFVKEDRFDGIIREAIAHHSDFSLPEGMEERTLLHARLIRDADKLDNCRVKLEEPMETLTGASAGEVGGTSISPRVLEAFFREESVRSTDRITAMDYWVSYTAYFFDLYFTESLRLIQENDFVTKIIRRVPYTNPDTRAAMERIESYMNGYIKRRLGTS